MAKMEYNWQFGIISSFSLFSPNKDGFRGSRWQHFSGPRHRLDYRSDRATKHDPGGPDDRRDRHRLDRNRRRLVLLHGGKGVRRKDRPRDHLPGPVALTPPQGMRHARRVEPSLPAAHNPIFSKSSPESELF